MKFMLHLHCAFAHFGKSTLGSATKTVSALGLGIKTAENGKRCSYKESCVRFALLDGVKHFGSGRFAHARNRP
jgi:hypothetical protein